VTRLWDKGEPLDAVVARFTAGRDPELDLRLVPFDALASAAHARGLVRIGLLGEEEEVALAAELGAIAREARAGSFRIASEEEDGHTAIENRLTARLGDAGRRIHAGRSRNDQVLAALRLYGREALLDAIARLLAVAGQLAALAEAHRETSVPGYTHTRQAMPSTLGLLFAAHAEALVDDLPWLWTAYRHLDRSPLGSASGYGVPLPLDRAHVAQLLAFGSVQANTLAVQNDRGKAEALVLAALGAVAGDLGRLATDLIWFSSDELRFVILGASVVTGSSLMPQKRNPDVLELTRATAARVRARQAEVAGVVQGLASGYHRDLQLTKEPFLEGVQATLDALAALGPVLATLSVDRARCREAITRSSGATDAACARAARGEPFRAAYAAVGAAPEASVEEDPAELWRRRTHLGAAGALELEPTRAALAEAGRRLDVERARIAAPWAALLGIADGEAGR
jgi:argininosuccinate lyase